MVQSDIAESAVAGIGTLLRQWRTERGWSQSALALRAGIAASTLSRWEAGVSTPGIPEWRSTLQALGIPVNETLPLLAAPRAVKQLKRDPMQFAPPVGGDLIRAMRMRCGMTQSELAGRVGVPQSAIAKWERSETWPDTARLHTLCYHLGAYPEEVTALTVGRFSLANLLDISDPDALHQEQWNILYQEQGNIDIPSLSTSGAALKDLRFLALEGRLHVLLSSGKMPGHDERLQRILSWTYARHAQYLRESDRVAESATPARHAVILQKSLWSKRNHEGWVPAIVAQAAEEVRAGGGRRSALQNGIALLQRFLVQASAPEYRAWLLSEMARYGQMANQIPEAVRYSEEALRSVMESDKEEIGVERRLRLRDHAVLLLSAGLPMEAVAFLPQADWQGDPFQNVRDLLVQAEVWHAVKQGEASNVALRQAYAILDRHSIASPRSASPLEAGHPSWQESLRLRADQLAKRLA